jgi:beta-lactamase regulating signal transducer with metallopeptidase domain/Flp pilus assembly protein TadD
MLFWLLENSLLALLLALPVALLAHLLRRRPALGQLLWCLVLLRLVMPPLPLPSWSGLESEHVLPSLQPEGRVMSEDEAWRFRDTLRLRHDLGGTWLQLVDTAGADWIWIREGRQIGWHAPMREYQRQFESEFEFVDPLRLEPPAWLGHLTDDPPSRIPFELDFTDARLAARGSRPGGLDLDEEPMQLWEGALTPRGARGIAGALTDDLGLLSSGRLRRLTGGTILQALFWLWLTGALLQLWSELRTVATLRRSAQQGNAPSPELQARIDALCARLSIPVPQVRLLDEIGMPLLLGLRHATLLLPTKHEPSDIVLAHELAQIARGSHRRVWFEMLVGILHWWNPIHWFARGRVRYYGQLACDARALALLPAQNRQLAEQLAALREELPPTQELQRNTAALLAVARASGRELQERRSLIMNKHLKAGWSPLARGVALLSVALALPPLLEARSAPPQEENPPQAAQAATHELLTPDLRAALEHARERRNGEIYYANRDWPRVVDVYAKFDATDVDFARSRHRYAVGLLGLQRWQEARPILQEQLALGFAPEYAHYNLGYAAMLAGQPELAWTELEAALRSGFANWKFLSDDPDLDPLRDAETGDPERFARLLNSSKELAELRERVEAHLRGDDWTAALPLLQQAHKISPNCGRCLAYLGFAQYQTRNLVEAHRIFRRQIELRFEPGDAYAGLAIVELARGNRELALEHLEKGIAAGFRHPMELLERREFRALQGDPVFEAMLDKVLRFERLRRQSKLWTEFRDWRAMREALRRELVTVPPQKPALHSWILGQLAEAELQLGQYDEARRNFEKQLQLALEPSTALFGLARLAAVQGKKADAFALLRLATEHGLEDPRKLYQDVTLRLLAKDERFRRVVQLAADRRVLTRFGATDWEYLRDANTRQVQEHPEDAEAWHKKGWGHLRLEEHVEAREAFRRQDALGHSPSTARYNIACSYALTGKIDDAFEWLELAVDAGFVEPKHIETDPDLRPLHGDPRFGSILEKARELQRDFPHKAQRKELWRKKD